MTTSFLIHITDVWKILQQRNKRIEKLHAARIKSNAVMQKKQQAQKD
jgi:hypothetical protein